jgi:hypothetical protein
MPVAELQRVRDEELVQKAKAYIPLCAKVKSELGRLHTAMRAYVHKRVRITAKPDQGFRTTLMAGFAGPSGWTAHRPVEVPEGSWFECYVKNYGLYMDRPHLQVFVTEFQWVNDSPLNRVSLQPSYEYRVYLDEVEVESL